MMIPWLPTIAQELWILVPRKYRLSATLAGSAYQMDLSGGPAGPLLPAFCGAGGGTDTDAEKVPAQSVPAASLAAEI